MIQLKKIILSTSLFLAITVFGQNNYSPENSTIYTPTGISAISTPTSVPTVVEKPLSPKENLDW
jgi:hypothetical protein